MPCLDMCYFWKNLGMVKMDFLCGMEEVIID